MAKYKTTNGILTGFVSGVGEIVNGVIEAPDNWRHGSNYEKIVAQPKAAPAAPAASTTPVAPAPNSTTETQTKIEEAK